MLYGVLRDNLSIWTCCESAYSSTRCHLTQETNNFVFGLYFHGYSASVWGLAILTQDLASGRETKRASSLVKKLASLLAKTNKPLLPALNFNKLTEENKNRSWETWQNILSWRNQHFSCLCDWREILRSGIILSILAFVVYIIIYSILDGLVLLQVYFNT